MKNLKNYNNFLEKNETVVYNYEDFMTNELLGAVKNLYKKATTTGEELKKQTKSKGETVDVAKDNINKMDTEEPEGGAVSKFVGKTKAKLGRELTGTNPFIDTKSGKICAMDVVLPKDSFKKVIELWKAGKKDDAANVLKSFAISERDAQFNIAVGLMMSASIAGLKSLKSKVIPKINPDQIDMGGAMGTDKGSYTGGDQQNFVLAPDEVSKKVVSKAKDVGDYANIGPKTPGEATFGDAPIIPAGDIDKMQPKEIIDVIQDQGLTFDNVKDLTPKALRKMNRLLKLVGTSPEDITEGKIKKAEGILNYLKDNNFIKGNVDDMDGLVRMKRALQGVDLKGVGDLVPNTSGDLA